MSRLEGSECIKALIPFVRAFSFTWLNLQAAKRRYQKQHEAPMPVEIERVMKEDFMNQRCADKIKWTVRILTKLRKDIKQECRGDLVKTITEGSVQSPCIISNADSKNKMRRIDCLRQADKVWRLDVVMVVLFRGIPLESTDGERLSKCEECKNPTLCINPYHIIIHVKELEVYLVSFIDNTQASLANIIPSVFSTNELKHMANCSISEGGSTREVLGVDYLASMLKMETDYHAEAQPTSNGQQSDLLEMCHRRKPSLSDSPHMTKRRRTLNNTYSADEYNNQDLHDESGNLANDVYEPKVPPSSAKSICRISSINDSNTHSRFSPQDELNTRPNAILESSKIEASRPHPSFSSIGIHNHVSLNLNSNNQHHHQQSQSPQLKSLINPQQTSDSKLVSKRLIDLLAQRFIDSQQRQRTSSHPHTIEYFHQGLQTESTSKSTAKLSSKPITTTAINILPSREKPVTATTSNNETLFFQQQNNEFKEDKVNSNVACLTSAVDCVLPVFHTFSDLKNYLKIIGLDVELVPVSNTTQPSDVPMQQPRSIDPIRQRLSTDERHQHLFCSNTINVAQIPRQPQIAMSSNDDGKRNRPSSISVPSNVLREKLLEYAPSGLSIRQSQVPSRPSTLTTQHQQCRPSSKHAIVSNIANLLSISNKPNSKEQPIAQQVIRQTLPPPPLLSPPSSSSSTPPTTVYHHYLTSVDKVSMMAKRDLIYDDVHLHDREAEEYMNMAATDRPTKQRKTVTSQTITDATIKSSILESGSASNDNEGNTSATSSSFVHHSTNANNNNNTHHHANAALANSMNKTETNSASSDDDSRSICDVLLMLFKQERTRSAQQQKKIEQVSQQHLSRNSNEQSHSSESRTRLQTLQGPSNENTNSTRILSPPAWISTSGKEKTLIHIQQNRHQTLKYGSSTSNNSSPPESQDCSPPDPNKSGLSPTKVVQFSQSIGSVQNLVPRPVPMLATYDNLVRHTSYSPSQTITPTGSNTSLNNGVPYTLGNRIFQSPSEQAFAVLSPVLSPFLSPSTSSPDTQSELMIIPADLLNVLNSRNWSEDELLQVFVNHIDSGGSGRRSRVNNEETKQQRKSTSMTNNKNTDNDKAKSIEK